MVFRNKKVGFEFEYPEKVYELKEIKGNAFLYLGKFSSDKFYEISVLVVPKYLEKGVLNEKALEQEKINIGNIKATKRYFEDERFGDITEVYFYIKNNLVQLILMDGNEINVKRFEKIVKSLKLL